jgi:hypothetical protein
MFCAPGHIFGGTKGVGSHFHVLHSRTHFRRYRGGPVSFSCFALPDSLSAVSSASGPALMFCAPELVFDGTEGVGSRFHVLRSRNLFRRYRWRPISFSCFARPDSICTIPRASGPVFIFCAPVLIVGVAECVGSHFHVLRTETHFRRYRGSRFSFSCFALSDSFSAVPRVSGPVFMFCAPALVFDGTDGVGSRYHVLRSGTRCRLCRVRRVPFSCFERPNSFSTVSRASVPVFMFCTPALIFGGTEGVQSCFHVLRSQTRCRWCRVRRFPLLCLARPISLSKVPRASVPVFMFCPPGIVFGGSDGVGSHFYVLRSRTHFRWYRGRQVPLSCFALPDSLSAVPSASGSVFKF